MMLTEDADSLWKFVVDHFWLLSIILALSVASWSAFVTFVLALAYMMRLILREKQIEEQRLL
jgi:hypothetical protein